MILPSLFFGFLSIIAFYKLAHMIFEKEETVFVSTIAYTLYPASMFFISGYPVSIMNLLAIIALIFSLKKKHWIAAFFSGLDTAAGPLPFFLSIIIIVDYITNNYKNHNSLSAFLKLKTISKLIAFSIISLWGIWLFIIYQLFIFKDPIAFLQAQNAWGSPTLKGYIFNIIKLYPIFGGGSLERHIFIHSLLFNPDLKNISSSIEIGFEWIINGLDLILISYLTYKQRKIHNWLFSLYGFLIIIFYIILHGLVAGPNSTIRLLYLDIPSFIGIGVIYEENPKLSFLIIFTFTIILFLRTTFFISGYWLVW